VDTFIYISLLLLTGAVAAICGARFRSRLIWPYCLITQALAFGMILGAPLDQVIGVFGQLCSTVFVGCSLFALGSLTEERAEKAT